MDLDIYCNTNSDCSSMILAQKTDSSRVQSPEISSHLYHHFMYGKGGKKIQLRKILSSLSGIGKSARCTQKNETGLFSYSIHKTRIKMD